jgi:GNAT superfamily N-acetyltransferase
MLQFVKTDSKNSDFIHLVEQLDADLAVRDGDEHAFYHQFNKIDMLKHVVVAYEDGIPQGCGAIKEIDPQTVEIKRMYTTPYNRGKGIASRILKDLEDWAKELNFDRCVLETGKKQPEAIALYTKNGFVSIPNYGQYKGIENSLCFEKKITHSSYNKL